MEISTLADPVEKSTRRPFPAPAAPLWEISPSQGKKYGDEFMGGSWTKGKVAVDAGKSKTG